MVNFHYSQINQQKIEQLADLLLKSLIQINQFML